MRQGKIIALKNYWSPLATRPPVAGAVGEFTVLRGPLPQHLLSPFRVGNVVGMVFIDPIEITDDVASRHETVLAGQEAKVIESMVMLWGFVFSPVFV